MTKRSFRIRTLPNEPTEDAAPHRAASERTARVPTEAFAVDSEALIEPSRPAASRPAEDSPVLHSIAVPTVRYRATGALFPSAASALSFLGAISGSGLAEIANAWLGPESLFWIEVPAAPEQAVPLAYAAGGTPFGGELLDDVLWSQAFPDGSVLPAKGNAERGAVTLITQDRTTHLRAPRWRQAELRELLLQTALVPISLRSWEAVSLFLPSGLSRWVLARALALDLEVDIGAATRSRLDGRGRSHAGIWMHMRGKRGPVSASWLKALSDLPGAIVVRAAGDSESRLWVDVGHRIPVSTALLSAMVPEGETWLLGGPESGHFRVSWQQLVPGALLLAEPARIVNTPQIPSDGSLPARLEVKLRSRPTAAVTNADALLLDDKELGWMLRYLVSRTLSEQTYVARGQDRHLVFVLGGLVERIPFGLPLAHVGPGALYLQQGTEFFPPAPEAARSKAYSVGLNGEDAHRAVILTLQGGFRFPIDKLVPAWCLWIGDLPKVDNTVVDPHTDSLRRLVEQLRLEPPKPAQVQPSAAAPARVEGDAERRRLREQAMALAARGRFIDAAEQLERAGDLVDAGYYYERAAAQLPTATLQPRRLV